MNAQELLDRLTEIRDRGGFEHSGDPEADHSEADTALLAYIQACDPMGTVIADRYDEIDKWYA